MIYQLTSKNLFSLNLQNDRLQPGDEIHPGQDREGREAGGEEEEEGGGGGAEAVAAERHQAHGAALQAQGAAEGGDPEEEGPAGQGATAASAGGRAGSRVAPGSLIQNVNRC